MTARPLLTDVVLTLRLLAHSITGPTGLSEEDRQHLAAAATLLQSLMPTEAGHTKQVLRGYIPELACIEPGDQFIITFFIEADGSVPEASFRYRPAEHCSWSLPIPAYRGAPQ